MASHYPIRNFTRVRFNADVSISDSYRTYTGESVNICLKGLQLKSNATLPMEIPLQIMVYPEAQPSFSLTGKIVWSRDNGFGIEITNMPLESFSTIREIVTKRSDFPEFVTNEVYRVVGCLG